MGIEILILVLKVLLFLKSIIEIYNNYIYVCLYIKVFKKNQYFSTDFIICMTGMKKSGTDFILKNSTGKCEIENLYIWRGYLRLVSVLFLK